MKFIDEWENGLVFEVGDLVSLYHTKTCITWVMSIAPFGFDDEINFNEVHVFLVLQVEHDRCLILVGGVIGYRYTYDLIKKLCFVEHKNTLK